MRQSFTSWAWSRLEDSVLLNIDDRLFWVLLITMDVKQSEWPNNRWQCWSEQLQLVCSKTIRNWHERWYFTSLSRGIGIQFSTSNNTTSRNGHWLVYRHCAKLLKVFQVQTPRILDTLQIFWVFSTTFNKCTNVQWRSEGLEKLEHKKVHLATPHFWLEAQGSWGCKCILTNTAIYC